MKRFPAFPQSSGKRLSLALLLVILSLHANAQVPDDWTLNRALQQVRSESPDARIAALRIGQAHAQLAEAKSQLWPRLIGETSYSITDNPVNAFMMQLNQRQFAIGSDFNHPGTTDNWGSELRLEYPLYTGGARKAAITGAELGVEAANYETTATLAQLEREVAHAWFLICQNREIVLAAEAAHTSQQSNLQRAQDMRKANTALQTAVLDLETRVAETEADLAYAINAEEVSLEFLKNLLGLETEVPFPMDLTLTPIAEPDVGTRFERPELLALARRAAQANTGITQAKAEQLPVISGFVSGRHDEGFTDRASGNSWMGGLMLRLPIWSGGEIRAKVDGAQKTASLARQQHRKQSLAIDFQIKTARLQLQNARQQILLADKGIQSAEESLRLTRQRFQEGLALSSQLIDGETAATGARVRLAKARAGEQMALVSLRHALGLPILESTHTK